MKNEKVISFFYEALFTLSIYSCRETEEDTNDSIALGDDADNFETREEMEMEEEAEEAAGVFGDTYPVIFLCCKEV